MIGITRGSDAFTYLSRDPARLRSLIGRQAEWVSLARREGTAAWTDDHSTILPPLTEF